MLPPPHLSHDLLCSLSLQQIGGLGAQVISWQGHSQVGLGREACVGLASVCMCGGDQKVDGGGLLGLSPPPPLTFQLSALDLSAALSKGRWLLSCETVQLTRPL